MSYLCTICQQQYEYREATTATDSGWHCACATSRAIKPDTHSLEMEVKRLQQENEELKNQLNWSAETLRIEAGLSDMTIEEVRDYIKKEAGR